MRIGKLAPNFKIVAVYKHKISTIQLSDYHNKKYVLLLFYPANFTKIAFDELLLFNDNIETFKELSTQILAISVDTPFSHLQLLKQIKLNFDITCLNYPLGSDLTHIIIQKYYVYSEYGTSFPSMFIIDKDGILQYSNVNIIIGIRRINDIIRILKSIQLLIEKYKKIKTKKFY